MKKRMHALFKGKVQGVGFRFSAVECALHKDLTGWVKNLDDGSVEIVAEGEHDRLEKFLAELNKLFARNIRDTDVQWAEATDEFSEFGWRFS